MNFNRVVTPITDRESWLQRRSRNLGASDAAALFSSHPYKTALELWGEHTGKLDPDHSDNPAKRRGRLFEPAVLAGLQEAHPEWLISKGSVYHELPELRLGATPDAFIQTGAPNAVPMLCQIKTVTPEKWESEWVPSPPAHYLIQCQVELLVTGMASNLLACMVMDGQDFPIYEYPQTADLDFQTHFLATLQGFWQRVIIGVEPKLDLKHDASTLARLHPQPAADPVLVMHGRQDVAELCGQYLAASAAIKQLEETKEKLGCEIMGVMRNHAKAECQDYRISWPVIPESVSTVRKRAHRRLSITKRKTGNSNE